MGKIHSDQNYQLDGGWEHQRLASKIPATRLEARFVGKILQPLTPMGLQKLFSGRFHCQLKELVHCLAI
jgi:hypothetical protein